MQKRPDEHDDLVMEIVAAALRSPAADRDGILHKACGQDNTLLAEVAGILEWEDRMGSFLASPLIKLSDLEDFEKLLNPGDTIANRFDIIREIGRGGMGVVYEGFDRKRNCRIAVKASKAGFRHLLSPELDGALRVRHPNVCLVNEIHSASTAFGDIDFLTMELLEGVTLSSHLQSKGSLSSSEVLLIARQLCAGLAEAHRSEIIHRDLKTSNIILTNTGGQPHRAVITDFGLAGSAGLDREEFGTPRYMAPELSQGQKASKASDIYALGVILHEMLTGEDPVKGAGKHDIDRRWAKVIRQCLSSAPAARPNASRVLSVFDRRPVWQLALIVAFFVALVALGMALYAPVRQLVKLPDIRLAFLPVEAPADLVRIGTGVLHDVVDQMNRSARSGATVLALPVSETLQNNIQTPQEAQSVLNATHAVQIKLRRENGQILTYLVVVDLAKEQNLRDFSGAYSEATIGSMPAALAGAIRLALNLHPGKTDSLNGPATVAYDRGLFFLRRDDDSFADAIPLFQRSARLDPHSPLPLAAIAEANVLRFEATKDHKALDDASQALQAAESLNPDSVAVRLIAGLLNKTQGQYEKALADYRRVQELEPRNVDALIRSASVHIALGNFDDAMACYKKAIALEPRYYGSYERLGRFYYYRGKYQEAAEQFQKTVDRAPGLYLAYNELGAALDYLGRDSEAEKALLSSLKIKETADALNSLGGIKAYQRHDAEAVRYFEDATRVDPKDYIYLLNLGDADRRLGQRTDAATAYRKAMALALAELQEDPRSGLSRAYVAYLAARLGDKKRAEDEITQARRFSPRDGMVLRKSVLTYEALGERDRAIDSLAEATADSLRELGRHPDLKGFRQDPRFQQLESKLSQARK